MAIEISGNASSHIHNANEAAQAQQQAEQKTKPSSGPAGAQGDLVTLTDAASQFQAIEKVIAKEPVVNLQKVDEVRAAVNNKQFDVNPGRVADKMLSFEGTACWRAFRRPRRCRAQASSTASTPALPD